MTEAVLTNPLSVGLDDSRAPAPCTLIIFGVTGDLAARKLIPALYNLAHDNLLPQPCTVVGVGRRDWTDDKLRQESFENVRKYSRTGLNDSIWRSFRDSLFYVRTRWDELADYEGLRQRLDEFDRQCDTGGNRLFYLAIPPFLYANVAAHLGEVGLEHSTGYMRIIVEKPIGHDLDSARELNQRLRQVFEEDQIYRIDHYLGKETVQNIAVFRFANSIFEPLWNRKYIDSVQITAAETAGVGTRGGYYDKAGALRDIIQNHAMQILTLVAMEPPVAWEANAVRDEKVKVLRAVHQIDPRDAGEYSVRGQYAAAEVQGEPIKGYLETEEVAPHSMTETYVALKLLIDNWRWAGVPFYLRTGKALTKRVTEVAIAFQQTPLPLFGKADPASRTNLNPNCLVLRIQPDEGITLRFDAKLPGQAIKLREVNMDFRYGTSFGVPTAEAYERLLLEAMLGEAKLFARDDEVEAAWAIMNRFLEGWSQQGLSRLPQYPAGSWGPKDADDWIERDGHYWRRL
jgi:glucose-6-phosphate 1-dehydrogenase